MNQLTRKMGLMGGVALLLAFLLSTGAMAGTATPVHAASQGNGKVIVVDLSEQWLRAYEHGKQVYDTAVQTGRDALPSPVGTYHIFAKESPTTFYSPWPKGSPYWYPPTPINYAMEWKAGGYYLHDATWHSVFGPGTNGPHYDPTFGWQDGSHGCVSMPLPAAAWLYHWAPLGTTVKIVP